MQGTNRNELFSQNPGLCKHPHDGVPTRQIERACNGNDPAEKVLVPGPDTVCDRAAKAVADIEHLLFAGDLPDPAQDRRHVIVKIGLESSGVFTAVGTAQAVSPELHVEGLEPLCHKVVFHAPLGQCPAVPVLPEPVDQDHRGQGFSVHGHLAGHEEVHPVRGGDFVQGAVQINSPVEVDRFPVDFLSAHKSDFPPQTRQ